jgi:ApbE superfamily uncharacterized protein (UPF0280 family)
LLLGQWNASTALQGWEHQDKKGHDVTCPKSSKFNKSETSITIEKESKWIEKANSQPIPKSNSTVDRHFSWAQEEISFSYSS